MTEEILIMVSNVKLLPKQSTIGSAGFDLKSNSEQQIVIPVGQRKLIKTGVNIKIHDDMVAMVCSRSGLALKHGISVANSPGIIDSDYIDEIGVILINHGENDFIVNHGDRIAQLVFLNFIAPCFKIVNKLEVTTRVGGFGSTGINNLNGSFS